jgi:hypothetical protein
MGESSINRDADVKHQPDPDTSTIMLCPRVSGRVSMYLTCQLVGGSLWPVDE